MSVSYRADIDGLRALAVLPVVLFHAHVAGFGGGFVGVDVFFVISGFLITGLIHKEVAVGEFSYLNFWERRARRLLPPMIFAVAASCVAAYFVLLPNELRAMGQSVVAFAGFSSNIYFWLKAGYFGAPAEMIPLLHTWSLAVEEQFYLFFPALMILLANSSHARRLGAIIGVGVVSFVIGLWWINSAPEAAYYLLPSRAWELMLGSFLALNRHHFATLKGVMADVLIAIGILMILVPVYQYSKATPFPGWAALAPCLGTALLIWVGQREGSVLVRVFTNGPTVFVGKLSYAIYLWHWPLLTLYAAASGKMIAQLSSGELGVLFAATFILSWLSYRFVENPIRRKQIMASPRSIFAASAVSLLAFVMVGFAAYRGDGFEHRIPAQVQHIADGARDTSPLCDLAPTLAEIEAGKLCRLGRKSGDAEVLLIGDSHASALIPAVHAAAESLQLGAEFVARGGCPPLPDIDQSNSQFNVGCAEHNRALIDLIGRGGYDKVVAVGLWTKYTQPNALSYIGAEDFASTDSKQVFARQFDKLRELVLGSGADLIIVDEVPYPPLGTFHPSRFAMAVWQGADPQSAGLSREALSTRQGWLWQYFDSLPAQGVSRFSSHEELCGPNGFCAAISNGRAVYRDGHHLSAFGAQLLGPSLADTLGGD